ncbi:MAG: RNA polymerase factor sigma-32 [Rhodospirillales bacterium]
MANQGSRNAQSGPHPRRGADSHDSELGFFLRSIRNYPSLDAATEAALVGAWQDRSEAAAADRLVGAQQRLVIAVAKEFRGYGLPLSDLVSEGNVGLMLAIDRFDTGRGFRLSTYAQWWIRRTIFQFVFRSSSAVRRVTTARDKRAFFRMRGLVEKHRSTYDNDLTPEAVAAIGAKLNIAATDVIALNHRLGARDLSINAPAGGDGGTIVEWQDLLVDDSVDLEARLIEADELNKRRALFRDALDVLDERERHILCERMLREVPASLSTLSARLGLSRERVRQIGARALEKVRKRVRRAAIDATAAAVRRAAAPGPSTRARIAPSPHPRVASSR